MKLSRFVLLLTGIALLTTAQPMTVHAETETIDLKALAKKARPAVMLLVVSDASGKEIATGTGFLVSSDGKLITNHHVIEKAASAVAKAENGGLFPVEGILASDPKNDLVLLKLTGKDLPFLTLGSSDKIEVGTRIAIIGSPLGLEGTLSEGIVSAVRELMPDMIVLQVTAAISPGSSGSPVMNGRSDVIGIASALLRGGQALNFAVPAEYGVRLMATVKPSSMPQSLGLFSRGDESAIFSDPDWRAADAAKTRGDSVEMLKRMKVLTSRYPDNATVWYYLGFALAELNLFDDAITAFQQAIKTKPDDVKANFSLADAYTRAKNLDRAEATYKALVALNPEGATTYYGKIIQMYDEAGQYDKAIEAARTIIKMNPKNELAVFNLGIMFLKLHRIDEAVQAFRDALALKPDYASAQYNIGYSYSLAKRWRESVEGFQKYTELAPDDPLGYLNVGVGLMMLTSFKTALEPLRKCIELKPDNAVAQYNLAIVYLNLKDNSKARKIYKTLLTLNPEYAERLKILLR